MVKVAPHGHSALDRRRDVVKRVHHAEGSPYTVGLFRERGGANGQFASRTL